MAYQGYLLKMNDIIIPNRYMQHNNCKIKVNTQDKNSGEDGYGVLHRNVLEHTSIKIEWYFPSATNVQLQELLSIFRSIWGYGPERRCQNTTVYVPEWDKYHTGDFYMPDPEFPVYNTSGGVVRYGAVRFALIEH